MRSLLLLPLLALAIGVARAEEGAAQPRAVVLAVIVHPKNPVSDISFSELRAMLKLERQFWPNGRRAVLYLRPGETDESNVLLEKIYKMTHEQLQKYWVGKLFSGEIPAKPSYVPTAEAAGSRVSVQEGAISIVLAGAVPKEVKVLTIDKKKVDDKEYALTGVIEPQSAP
ncbi:MAG: hypothetical protein ACT4PV_11245 [Planctomycetaceae bacterium]